MSQRDDLLRRVMAANPLPAELELPEDVADSRPPIDLLINGARVVPTHVHHGDPATTPPPGKRSWRTKPAIVFAAAGLLVLGAIGIVVLSTGGQPDFADEAPPTTMTQLPADSTADVEAVAVAPDGSLWAATDVGIVRWDLATGAPTVYTTDDGLPTADTLRVVVGSDGAVWTGGPGWMARFDGSWTTFSAPEIPLAVGPDGSVWTAYGERELARFDGSDWETFEVPLSLDQGFAVPWTAFLDVAADGTVWTGTHEHEGVFAFDGADWTHYSSVDGLPAPLSGTVAAAPDGTVWVGSVSIDGSPGAGAARFDGTTWTVYTTADGLLDDIPDVAVGADGTVWAVHETGVSRFDGNTWTAFPGVEGMGGFVAAVDAAGTLWMPARDGGVIGFDGIAITRLDMPTTQAAPSPTISTFGPAGTWNPILASTRAKPAPPAATCPPGTTPDAPGPVDQERPEAGWTSILAAAFDHHAGRIVYVDTLGGTWTFDVCTSTWDRMRPAGALIGELSSGLVYDVDSDVTVALGFEHISVYDATTNTWTQPENEIVGINDGVITPIGAAYDPISGLIVATTMSDTRTDGWDIWAYDVDTSTWTLVGAVPVDRDMCCTGIDFLGYAPEVDRLILTTYVDDRAATLLIDPRTGETTLLPVESPYINLGWPSGIYGPAGDTVYAKPAGNDICGFDTGTLTWSDCLAAPDPLRDQHVEFAAMVDDPINRRLFLINRVGGDWLTEATDDVWAIDLTTGEWTQLLAPSRQ